MRSITHSIFVTALLITILALPSAASAQEGRLSLAERVARMEQQLQGQQGTATLEQLNRLNELQSEVRELRGLVEQQQFEISNLNKQLELASRMNRTDRSSAGDPGAAAAAAAAGSGFQTVPSPDLGQTAPRSQGFEDISPTPDPYAPPGDPARNALDTRPPSDDIDVTSVPPPPGTGVVGEEEKREYDAARAQLDAGQYASAARAFAEFVRTHPDGELTANALYWLGESYYVTQNFQIALDTFRDLVSRFPDSNKVADAMLKIGYCHFELQQFDDAETALNEVISRYPDTTVSRLAQGRLRALQTDRGAR